jgi:hypothetical protein
MRRENESGKFYIKKFLEPIRKLKYEYIKFSSRTFVSAVFPILTVYAIEKVV